MQFHTGVGIRVQEISGTLDVMVSLPPTYGATQANVTAGKFCHRKYGTRGLLGVYNGSPSDDFTDPNCTVINPRANQQRDPAYEEMIYDNFGIKCRTFKIRWIP